MQLTERLKNSDRLKRMVGAMPLVTGDETIAVLGAGGQIGSKILPELERHYPGQVLACDFGKPGYHDVSVTNKDDVRKFIKEHNVKVIINLAALLSGAAENNPKKAHEINYLAPRDIMEIASEGGVRKVMTMSSIAAQEFDKRLYESEEAQEARTELQKKAPTGAHFAARASYGQSKTAIEADSRYYTAHRGIQAHAPRLAGVLTCHHKDFADGTTEELDGLIIAAAVQEVYKDKWQEKMRKILGKQHQQSLDKGHYLVDDKYVPEVGEKATFDMIDGGSLAKVAMLILHKDISPNKAPETPDPVQNVSEYSVSMEDAVSILKELNPDFAVQFATSVDDGLNPGKVKRAKIWPKEQDTAATEGLIGPFKEFDARRSITESYRRLVRELQAERLAESGIAIAPKDEGKQARG